MARVLIAGFCSLPGPDRAGVQLGHVLRALGRRNSVDVLCVRRGDQAYVERRGAARVLRVPVSDEDPLARVETFRRALRRQLEGAEYDAVVVRDGYSGIPALEMRESLEYALVFDAGRSPMAEPPLADPALAQVAMQDEDDCVREADLVLAPTEAARQYLATRARPERVHTVPLGVDIDLFDWDDNPQVGSQRVMCVGSWGEGDGLDILLAAMRPIAAASDVHLVIAGGIDPKVRSAIEAQSSAGDLKGRVELIGEIDHRRIPDLIATATVCVAPTAAELSPRPTTVFPTKLLEYMACRRAVVAPRTGTVTLLMRDRQHGLLFNPGDASSLTTQLARLLSDDDLRDRLARGGYDMIRRTHSASAVRRAVRRAFSWLATQGPWAEKWNRTDEVEDGNLVQVDIAPDAEITESIGFAEEGGEGSGPRQPISYTAEQTLYVADELQEPEDHTMVEGAGLDTAESSLRGDTRGDDWVVEENRRQTDSFQLGFQSPVGEDSSPVESRFVAGELVVGESGDDSTAEIQAEESEPSFTAMSPLLGTTPAPEVIEAHPAGLKRPPAPPPMPKIKKRVSRPTVKSEPPQMAAPAPRATGKGTGPVNTPTPTLKMGPPARVSSSDAVRSALSAAKRTRAETGAELAAPKETSDAEGKTSKLERPPTGGSKPEGKKT